MCGQLVCLHHYCELFYTTFYSIYLLNSSCLYRLSGSSCFLHPTDHETTKLNIQYCRITYEEFYEDVTGEAILFMQQCLKRSPR
jgi:hypothetical protein